MSTRSPGPQHAEMACKELVELVTDYLEGALPAVEHNRFEAHLAECPFCTDYVEQMRAVGGSLGGLARATEAIAPDKRDALLAAFRKVMR